jgi:hypothetical protein
VAADCRMTVWIVSEEPNELYGMACVGNCADQGDTCEIKVVTQGPTTYHYCKCTQAGTPTEPDSTACTTVVTLTGDDWSHYCYNQACSETCVSYGGPLGTHNPMRVPMTWRMDQELPPDAARSNLQPSLGRPT